MLSSTHPRYRYAINEDDGVLLKELANHPFTGTGKPEQLKYSLTGIWSRRINHEHRLVYEVVKNSVLIHSAKGHYN